MVRLSLYVEHRNRSGCAGIDDHGPSQGTDQTEVRKVEDPQPGPGEVTIDVAYAGINFMDVMARRGDPGYASGWPYTPGLEVSGTVREVGPGFTTLASASRSSPTPPAAVWPRWRGRGPSSRSRCRTGSGCRSRRPPRSC